MLIVTHFNPDIDAIGAVWLLKKFGPPAFRDAKVAFVPAGKTWQDQPVDSDTDVTHVDTGLGQFDHHQTADKKVCASTLVLDFLEKQGFVKGDSSEALSRLAEVIRQVDHFEECFWPEPDFDRYEFMLMPILEGLKLDNELDDHGLIDFGGVCLTGIWQSLRQKIRAEKDLASGIEANSVWGKTLLLESGNTETLHLAQKKGFDLVVRKDPQRGMVKIGARPDLKLGLKELYNQLLKADPEATWYLHPSGKLLLNGSSKNPHMKPSRLSILELLSIIKNIK